MAFPEYMNILTAISNLGDIGVTTPIAGCIAVFFALRQDWKLTAWWVILFAFGLSLVVVSKVAFVGWGIGYQELDFTGFSGHAMRAMAIFPVLGYLVVKKKSIHTQTVFFMLGIGLGLIVGISRQLLNVHSWSEVIAGCVLGLAVSVCFVLILSSSKQFSFYRPLLIIAMVPILMTPYLKPTPTQSWIIDFSLYLSGHDQPFTRNDWQLSTSIHTDEPWPAQKKAFQESMYLSTRHKRSQS
jgi:membrane-associated phospholipid phosphatase